MIYDDVVFHSVSQDYTGTNFVSYWNSIGPTAGTISDLQASRFAMIRFPGGVPCDWFDWQNPGPGNWGILDAKAIAQPSGAKIVYQTNIYDAGLTGQNTAATVTAIDAFMKANGVEVGMWEGGNEPEYGPRQGQPAATYMSEYNTNYGIQYTALKAVSPTIPMIGPGSTVVSNLALFLQAHGNRLGDSKVDGVSMHWYAGGGFSGPDYKRDAAQTSLVQFVAAIKATIQQYDTRPLPIYITEWNWINTGGWGDYDYTFTAVNDADIIGQMLELGVAGHTQFDLQVIAGSFGMITDYDGYREPHRNDVNSVFMAITLAQKLGTDVLRVDNPADHGNSLSAYATKTADGHIQVMLCNKDYLHAQDVSLSFSSYNPDGRSLAINTLSNNTNNMWAESSSTLNGVLMPQPQVSGAFPAPTTVTVGGSNYTVHLPANGSMAVLIFGGAGTITPTLTSIVPASGPLAGGTSVTITGTNFAAGATVMIGGAAATGVTVGSATSITCITPLGTAGAKDMAVTVSGQTGSMSNAFTYLAPRFPTVVSIAPASGPLIGGTAVTITGTNFAAGATVTIGGAAATGVTVASASSVTCITPSGTAGAKDVVVTVSGQSGSLSNGFTYLAPGGPTVTSIAPASGPLAGGTSVTITGTNFAAGATVMIGGAAATGVTVVSASSITCTAPAGAAGVVNVAVTTAGLTAIRNNGFIYTDSINPRSTGFAHASDNGPSSQCGLGGFAALFATFTLIWLASACRACGSDRHL